MYPGGQDCAMTRRAGIRSDEVLPWCARGQDRGELRADRPSPGDFSPGRPVGHVFLQAVAVPPWTSPWGWNQPLRNELSNRVGELVELPGGGAWRLNLLRRPKIFSDKWTIWSHGEHNATFFPGDL